MLTMLLAAVAIGCQDADQRLTGPVVVSTMLTRYAAARTVSGTISMVQKLDNQATAIETWVEIKRPDRVYVYQKSKASKRVGFVVSDGTYVTYNPPRTSKGAPESGQLIEPLDHGDVRMTIPEMYAIASRSLLDCSTPLDIAIAGVEDLKMNRDRWATCKLAGEVEVDGKPAYRVIGDWRPVAKMLPTGKYEMIISKQGDLLRYNCQEVMNRTFKEGEKGKEKEWSETHVFDTAYVVNLKVDGPVNEKLFTVKVPGK